MTFASLDRYAMSGLRNGDGLVERRDDQLQHAYDLFDDPRNVTVAIAVRRRSEQGSGQGADENE